MMSTIGRELLTLMDVTWKKGNRSNSRRKPAGRNITMGIDEETRKGDDPTTASDNEKNGVDILGRHFRDKLEHVPIKKRRFQVGSPSWLKQNSPSSHQLIESSSLSKRQRRSCDELHASKVTRNSLAVEIDGKSVSSEDFSGIEILAAVACDNGITENCPSHCESVKLESSSSGTALACQKSLDAVEDVASMEDIKPFSNPLNCNDALPPSSSTVYAAVSSRVHWDLNVAMDAWETPCSTMSAVGAVDSSVRVNTIDMTRNKWSKVKIKEESNMGSADNVKDSCHHQGKSSEQEAVVTPDADALDHCDPSITDHSTCTVVKLEPLDRDLHVTDQEREVLPSGSNLQLKIETAKQHADPINEGPQSAQETEDVSCVCDNSTLKSEECVQGENKVAFDEITPIGNQVKVSLGSNSVTFNKEEDTGHEVDVTVKVELEEPSERESACGVLVQAKTLLCDTPLEGLPVICTSTVKHPDEVLPCSTILSESPRHDEDEDLMQRSLSSVPHVVKSSAHDGHKKLLQKTQSSISNATKSSEKHACGEVKQKSSDPVAVKSPALSEEVVQKSSVDSTVTLSDRCGERCIEPLSSMPKTIAEEGDNSESNAFSADKIQAVCSEEVAGYDSQFEDGEFRESIARDVDDDGERPCSDENTNLVSLEAQCSISNLKDVKVERRVGRPCKPLLKQVNGRIVATQKTVPRSPQTKNLEVTVDKEPPGIIRPRAPSKDPLPSTGRLDIIRSKDPQPPPRVENGPALPKDDKEINYRKFVNSENVGFTPVRSPKGRPLCPPSSGYWNPERRSSPSLGPYKPASLRPKTVLNNRGYPMASDHSEFDPSGLPEPDSRTHRNYMNMAASEGQYERFPRRTPNDRDEGYCGIHRPVLPNRDMSPGRNNFGRYHDGVSGSDRNEYQRPLPDDMMDYNNRQRFVRRERSTSPIRGRRTLFRMLSRKSRSRSRSRSRSPGYFEPRELNNGSRFQSRSPTFSLNRERMPFQKRMDFGDEISPSRPRFSPQNGSRCFDDRSISMNRKSPIRTIRSGQRFDSGHGLPRLNPDGPYRPMHSRKFTDMSGASTGGEYDGNDDDERRKGRDRFDPIHRMRPYDNEGDVRRFRYDMDEPFVDNDSLNFNDSNRKLTDWRMNSDAPYKQAMQSRRVNLWGLNPDGPYRPAMHSRKFSDYGDNDGDRRKGRDRYEMVHRLRRYDTKGPVRRFRYDADDHFLVNGPNTYNEPSKKLTDRRPMNRAGDDS